MGTRWRELPIIEIRDKIALVYGEVGHHSSSNVFVIDGEIPSLIDCGSLEAFPSLKRNLEEFGVPLSRVKRICLTHGDIDHVEALVNILHFCPDAEVILHHADWKGLITGDSYLNSAYVYGRSTPFVLPKLRLLSLDHGTKLQLGDDEWEIIHTPGHTPGSECVLGGRDHDLLFAGDTIGGAMRDIDGSNLEEWLKAFQAWKRSLALLSQYKFIEVWDGHHDKSRSRQDFDEMVANFGRMLNPWFLLANEKVQPEVMEVTEIATLAHAG